MIPQLSSMDNPKQIFSIATDNIYSGFTVAVFWVKPELTEDNVNYLHVKLF